MIILVQFTVSYNFQRYPNDGLCMRVVKDCRRDRSKIAFKIKAQISSLVASFIPRLEM